MDKTLVRRAELLSWFTIIYNLLEGILSIIFGLNDDSLALAGFGVDSLIEVASAFLILWRFRDSISLERERSATLGIGVLFLFLSFFTLVGSILLLKSGSHPSSTIPGVLVSLISLSFMFFLWSAKRTVGTALNSPAMLKDAVGCAPDLGQKYPKDV